MGSEMCIRDRRRGRAVAPDERLVFGGLVGLAFEDHWLGAAQHGKRHRLLEQPKLGAEEHELRARDVDG